MREEREESLRELAADDSRKLEESRQQTEEVRKSLALKVRLHMRVSNT